VAALVAQRWILARPRTKTFFSIEVLNERIGDLLEELNARPTKKPLFVESRGSVIGRS
jgi:hypothetical protein